MAAKPRPQTPAKGKRYRLVFDRTARKAGDYAWMICDWHTAKVPAVAYSQRQGRLICRALNTASRAPQKGK